MSAVEWLVGRGYDVYMPLGHSADCDFVADIDGRLERVQVKTSICRQGDRYAVMLATKGGNRSWTGTVKRFSAERCDRLFVLVGDGRRWWIPSTCVEARTAVVLGGPKYAEYEVEPGRPLPQISAV